MNQLVARIVTKKASRTKLDVLLQNESVRSPQKLILVYHIGVIGHWNEVVDEQMSALHESGLYEKLDSIYVGSHGPNCTALITDKFQNDSKVSIAVCEELEKTYENKTMNKLLDIAKENNDSYILYIHSKGVTAKNKIQSPWRKYMMDKMVMSHQVSIDLLNRGFETIGTMLLLKEFFSTFSHYSGNFFWASTNYISQLEPITKLHIRHEAEKFILSKMIKDKHLGLGPVWFNIPIKFLNPLSLYKKNTGQINIVYKI